MKTTSNVANQHVRLSGAWRRPARRMIALAIACLPLLALAGCSRSGSQAAAPSQTPLSAGPQASYFTVPPAQMAHVQVLKVRASSIPQVLRLPGSVTYNQFETTPVITQVSGPVLRVLAFPGQMVRAGQPLMEVTSPDYAQMRGGYIKVRSANDLAEKILRRSQALYNHHAISLTQLQQAQSAAVAAQANLTAAWQSLRVLGVSDSAQVLRRAVSPEIPVLAPIGGEVVERTVSPGQVVQGGTTQCFMISNMSTVWVQANVYQSQLAYIHLGDPVTIQTDAYPEVFRGRISYIAPAFDPATRTLQVRIVTQNSGQKLKKDMYVTVLVNAGAIRNALTVPNSAVLRNSENQPFVYLAVAPGQFGQRLVTTGETQGNSTEIVGGLEAGQEVVADGSLFLQFANSLQH